MTSIGVTVETFVNVDEVFADLNREATQAKRAGDMGRAVSLLREAKARRGDLYQETRLANFLQQAGQVEEALVEIQWLLDRSDRWSKEMFGHQPTTVRLRQKAMWRGQIHRAAQLICQRAKLADKCQEHARRQEEYFALVDKIDPLCEADKAQRRRERDEALALARRGCRR